MRLLVFFAMLLSSGSTISQTLSCDSVLMSHGDFAAIKPIRLPVDDFESIVILSISNKGKYQISLTSNVERVIPLQSNILFLFEDGQTVTVRNSTVSKNATTWEIGDAFNESAYPALKKSLSSKILKGIRLFYKNLEQTVIVPKDLGIRINDSFFCLENYSND